MSKRIARICSALGHWLVNVEEGVARCRICRSRISCNHARAWAEWDDERHVMVFPPELAGRARANEAS